MLLPRCLQPRTLVIISIFMIIHKQFLSASAVNYNNNASFVSLWLYQMVTIAANSNSKCVFLLRGLELMKYSQLHICMNGAQRRKEWRRRLYFNSFNPTYISQIFWPISYASPSIQFDFFFQFNCWLINNPLMLLHFTLKSLCVLNTMLNSAIIIIILRGTMKKKKLKEN